MLPEEKSESFSKYCDGILTFDEAFEGMLPKEKYSLLNAQKLEIPFREEKVKSLESEIAFLNRSIENYRIEAEKHIKRIQSTKEHFERMIEDSKKNLEKFSNVLEAGYPKE